MEFDSYTSEYLSMCANASSNASNATSYLWILPDKTSGQVSAAFLLLFLVLGLPWNLLVVVAIVKQRLYTQPSIILLLNLVIADLMLIVLHLPFLITVGLSGEYVIGGTDAVRCAVCKVGLVSNIFELNSIFIVTFISFDRFLFIYKHLKYDLYITSCRILLVLCVAWIVAILVPLIPLSGYGEVVYSSSYLSCAVDFSLGSSYYSLILITVAILPMPFLLVFNMWVCCIVQKNIRAIYKVRKSLKYLRRKSQAENNHRSTNKIRQQKELHLIRVFGALLCSNIITWLPIIILSVLLVFGMIAPSAVIAAVNVFFLSQVLLHPAVEIGLIRDVREPLLKWLFCCCLRLKPRLESTRVSFPQAEHSHDSTVSSQSPPCCGCLELCSTAIWMQPDHSASTSNSHELSRTVI